MFEFKETKLKGAYVIEPILIEDERGFFSRSWCQSEFEKIGLDIDIKQSNLSFSKKRGTLRGLHYQKQPHQESKILRCVKGAIFDVIVDLRPESKTYKRWFGTELTANSYKMIYIPKDFAHGFLTLKDNCEIMYQVSEFYKPEAEAGIRWDDPNIDIKWPIKPVIITEKDQSHPNFV